VEKEVRQAGKPVPHTFLSHMLFCPTYFSVPHAFSSGGEAVLV
jgi:hypothetical protein